MLLFRLFAALLGELVAPSLCAACDGPVAMTVLFCASCATMCEPTLSPNGVFTYGGAVADAVIRYKFRRRPDLASRFARAMIPLARGFRPDVVVPVPLHPRRLADRGYNQAALLSRPIARALDRPHSARALLRIRDTPMQSLLNAPERRRNLNGAFRVRNSRIVTGKNVLLVDDVQTTGSTLDACTRALHEVGARRVFPLVLACRDGLAV